MFVCPCTYKFSCIYNVFLSTIRMCTNEDKFGLLLHNRNTFCFFCMIQWVSMFILYMQLSVSLGNQTNKAVVSPCFMFLSVK